jgi:xanthine dehydrogenase accessory factor
MIGSKTKRAAFAGWYRKNGGVEERLARLACPIGRSRSGDKRPEAIAAFAAAEIMDALSCRARPAGVPDQVAARIP